MDTNAWTGDLVLGALPWADMTIEDAIYYIERAGMTRGDFNEQQDGGWWLDKQSWACTANDAVEDGVNTGWKTPNGNYVSTNGNDNGQMVATSERGVLCAGDADSKHGILEVTESAFVNFNFETDIDGMPLKLKLVLDTKKLQELLQVLLLFLLILFGVLVTIMTNIRCSILVYNGLQLITEFGTYTASSKETYLLPSINMSLV